MSEQSNPASEQKPIWEPIATAPRDNKRPLYLARINENGKLLEIDFDGGWEFWQESYEMPHICGWGWCSANGIEEPTHWAFQDAQLPSVPQPDYKAQRDALLEALEEETDAVQRLMNWCVKNVDKWDFPQYDNLSCWIEKRKEIVASVKGTTP